MGRTSRFINFVLLLIAVNFVACSASKRKGAAIDESAFLSGKEGSPQTIAGLGSLPNMTPTDAQAIQTVATESQPLVPQIDMDFSDEIDDGFFLIEQMEEKGQDTSAIRLQLAGQMMSECAVDAAQYRPYPGEPLLGTWENKCPNASSGSRMTTKANYLGGTNGSTGALKSITILGAGWGPGYTSAGGGSCTVDTNGGGTCGTVWKSSGGVTNSYVAQVTDQPNAGTGVFHIISGTSPDCSSGTTSLVSSTNPIPGRYSEAMRKMAACYKRAITLTSPILWKQISQLSPEQQQQVISAMGMKNN